MNYTNAPFPYFGGKARVASKIWAALGQPKHYIEPFFGSGAVLLLRPGYDPGTHVETVNDKDGFVSNVWRSLKFSPDETAKWADWPVNHADLSARKKTMLNNEARLLENLIADDEWHDPKMAGYWIWAASCWIGSGLTSIGQRPHLSNAGNGVHRIAQSQHIYEWFAALSARLRRVRVVCGDWTRVCGGNWQDNMGICGMFFDPPYGVKDRDCKVYHFDSTTVANDVMAFAIGRGSSTRYRIVIAGYEEYAKLVDEHGWSYESWTTNGGYGNQGNGRGKANRQRETLYYSPHCLRRDGTATLFDELEDKENA